MLLGDEYIKKHLNNVYLAVIQNMNKIDRVLSHLFFQQFYLMIKKLGLKFEILYIIIKNNILCI